MAQKHPFTTSVRPEYVSALPPAGDAPSLEPLLGDPGKVKAAVRRGAWPVQHEARRSLWRTLIRVRFPDAPRSELYAGFVRDVFGEGDMRHDVSMPRFVGAATERYKLADSGMAEVKEVICVVGVAQPEITHAPHLFPLTCLLLHYMEPEDCFHSLSLMLQSRAVTYLPQTQTAEEAAVYVMVDLMGKFSKKCHRYLLLESQDRTRVVDGWMCWIFQDLPFPYVVRVVDCFLMEGIKVLYRVGLAIMSFFYKLEVKPRKDAFGGSIGDEIRRFCRGIENHVTIEQLLQKAFTIRNFSRKELARLMLKYEQHAQETGKGSLPSSPSHHSFCEPISLEDVGSKLLTGEQWSRLWQWLPARTRLNKPTLLFSTSVHGTSITTFYNKCEEYEPTLLVVKALSGEIFGAYCSVEWLERTRHKKNLAYFGTGETFVYTLCPEMQRYDWVGKKLGDKTPNQCQLFQAGDTSCLCVGGGTGVAIRLDENLYKGLTDACDTFASPPLVDGKDFQCSVVEVFGFL